MDPSSEPRAPSPIRRFRAAWGVRATGCALLVACGGTNGLESIPGAGDVPGVDATVDGASRNPEAASPVDASSEAGAFADAGDATTGDATTAEAATSDADVYDRATPPRPDAKPFERPDTGSISATEAGADAAVVVIPGSTVAMLVSRGPACMTLDPDGGPSAASCATVCLDPAQLYGSCELVPAMPADPITLSDGGPAFTSVCLKALWDMFQSHCADQSMTVPCLCGSADTTGCLNGTATPSGPLYSEYKADFGSTISDILTYFTAQNRGAGQANAIMSCLQMNGCACFGGAVDAASR
jgi:hypothetical protein